MPKLNQRGFTPIIFILGILVLSAGIVGGTFFIKSKNLLNQNKTIATSSSTLRITPPPTIALDQTTNWQTVSIGKLQLKIPPGWWSKLIGSPPYALYINQTPLEIPLTANEGKALFVIILYPSGSIDKLTSPNYIGASTNFKKEQITINKATGVKISDFNNQNTNSKPPFFGPLILLSWDQVYGFTTNRDFVGSDIYYNKILSTFNFEGTLTEASASAKQSQEEILSAERDSRRKADITAISFAMIDYQPKVSSTYIVLSGKEFANGKIPIDPIPGNVYCAISPSSNMTLDSWTTKCPTGWSTVGEGNPGAVTSWTICAWLASGKQFCKSSQ